MCIIDFNLWREVLTNPVETFKKHEKKADLGKAAMQLLIAGLIAGFFTGIGAVAGLATAGSIGGVGAGMMGAGMGLLTFIAALVMTPIIVVIGWLIGSGIIYVFAMIFGGKGNFTVQSHLIALYTAPLIIVSAILGLIPILGGVLSLLLGLYSLYLLTMALKQVHKVSTGKAVAIWLIPIIALSVVAFLFMAALVLTMLPVMAA